MISDTAYWSLNTIATVTATLLGFFIVALIFFFQSTNELRRATLWMKRNPELDGRVRKSLKSILIIILIPSMVTIVLGFLDIFLTVNMMTSIPGSNSQLSNDLLSQFDLISYIFIFFIISALCGTIIIIFNSMSLTWVLGEEFSSLKTKYGKLEKIQRKIKHIKSMQDSDPKKVDELIELEAEISRWKEDEN